MSISSTSSSNKVEKSASTSVKRIFPASAKERRRSLRIIPFKRPVLLHLEGYSGAAEAQNPVWLGRECALILLGG